MKILGAGLSKTGTTSLSAALEMLGYEGIHFDTDRLNKALLSTQSLEKKDLKVYDDLDFVTDLPSAFFWKELACLYPDCKIILTVRDTNSWWHSIEKHINRTSLSKYGCGWIGPLANVWGKESFLYKKNAESKVMRRIRELTYGSRRAIEWSFKKKYDEHNQTIINTIPPKRLLVLNLEEGDGWEELCSFLEIPIPNIPFPVKNSAPK